MLYQNQAFENQDLVLDGNDYIDCTFKNCTLVYSASGQGGKIEPLDAKNVRIKYEGAARVAVDLHSQALEEGFAMAPVGAYVRYGPNWFQRVPVPTNVGAHAGQTKGMAVVIP